jgi:hypothetical protein
LVPSNGIDPFRVTRLETFASFGDNLFGRLIALPLSDFL